MRWRPALKSADFPFDEAALFKAVELAKTDLTTELVKEFTELQGVIGGLYARAQGLGETVAQAIYDQYTPASTEDADSGRRSKASCWGLPTAFRPSWRCSASATRPRDRRIRLRCAARPMRS